MKIFKQIVLVLIVLIAITSCGTLEKVTTLDPQTGRFPAKNRTVKVIKSIDVNADTLKTLIIVPNTEYCIGMVKNMNYFNDVMTFVELQQDIIAKGLADEVSSVSDRVGLNNAYRHYRPFVVLKLTTEKKAGNVWYIGLRLYDPRRADYIFENEIMLDQYMGGLTDQKIFYPLFNSLLDYLYEQE